MTCTDLVSNQAFIDTIFANRAEGAAVWVCLVKGDPKAKGQDWSGSPCVGGKLPDWFSVFEDQNQFFTVSTIRRDQAGYGRRESNCAGCHVVVLDDIGEKAALPAGFVPSYTLETSPGSHQVGLILDEPCTDLPLLKQLATALAKAGMTDAGAKGFSSRYVRLPVGRNRKVKCGADGFAHVLHTWSPERKFSIDQIVAELGLTLESPAPALVAKPSASSQEGGSPDQMIIARLLRSEKTRAAWLSEDGEGSEGDAYLLTRIAHQTADPDQIARIYGQSPRADRKSSDGTCKWRTRKDYRDRSIKAAIAHAEANPGGDVDEAVNTIKTALASLLESGDNKALFDEDSLEAIATLKRASPGDYATIRSQLKKAGVQLGLLDASVRDADGGNRLLDADAADHAIARLGGPESLIFSQGQFWHWREGAGCWRRVESDEVIKQAIHSVLPRQQITAGNVGSVFAVMRTKCAREVSFDQAEGFTVNVANGTLELQPGQGWKLREHRREDFYASCLPVEWNPDAECPEFWKFLASITEGEDDFGKSDLILNGIGYTCMPTCSEEVFFLMYGPASNGKSTLLRVIEGLLGKDNASALNLHQMSERFAVAKLQGKLANLCSEIPRGAAMPDAIIKGLVSGDSVTAEFKGRDLFEFRNRAKLWFACNNLPSPKDMSPALVEKRARLIELPRSFLGEDRDPHLASKLLAELPGILATCLNWFALCHELARAPGGWMSVTGEGLVPWAGAGFVRDLIADPPSSVAAKAAWRMASDPVRLFADERLVGNGDEDIFTPSADLFAAWKEWASENGVTLQLNAHQLALRIKALMPLVRTGEKRAHKRGVVGLSVREVET